MAAILDAILKIIAFPMWDFGRLLVCYLWYQILPKSVEKPFVAICWGLNCRLTRLDTLCKITQKLAVILFSTFQLILYSILSIDLATLFYIYYIPVSLLQPIILV